MFKITIWPIAYANTDVFLINLIYLFIFYHTIFEWAQIKSYK